MKLKTKLSLGIGFLFFMILTIVFFCRFYIGKMSLDSDNILKDNYNSVLYAKDMSSAIDEMMMIINSNNADIDQKKKISYRFESQKNIFQKNLQLELSNITEPNEKDYAANLSRNFDDFVKTGNQMINGNMSNITQAEVVSAYQYSRGYIDSIADVNIKAIYSKNQFAKKDAEYIITIMGIVGVISILLGFGYFWYFPFYVSHSIAYLSEKMLNLLDKAHIGIDMKTKDESFIILRGIELLDNKYYSIFKTKKEEDHLTN